MVRHSKAVFACVAGCTSGLHFCISVWRHNSHSRTEPHTDPHAGPQSTQSLLCPMGRTCMAESPETPEHCGGVSRKLPPGKCSLLPGFSLIPVPSSHSFLFLSGTQVWVGGCVHWCSGGATEVAVAEGTSVELRQPPWQQKIAARQLGVPPIARLILTTCDPTDCTARAVHNSVGSPRQAQQSYLAVTQDLSVEQTNRLRLIFQSDSSRNVPFPRGTPPPPGPPEVGG